MHKINLLRVGRGRAQQGTTREATESHEKAGRFEKAIELLKQVVADDPRDWNTIKKLGDLYARINRNKEAAQEYAKVAESYAKGGFLLKAIAVLRQIQKLEPSALEAYVHLAGLYAKQGLMVEAKGQYQIVADEYKKRGNIRDAAEALRKMVEIEPEDLKSQSMLAELYLRDGNSTKAIEVYITIAETLDQKGHPTEALQVLERGLKIDPGSAKIRVELARGYVNQRKWDKVTSALEGMVTSEEHERILAAMDTVKKSRPTDHEEVRAALLEIERILGQLGQAGSRDLPYQ